MQSLEGRVAVVTGGTGTLGSALVECFLAAGMKVHVPWVSSPEAEALREQFGDADETRLSLYRTDITRPDEVEELFRAVDETEHRLDILANIVGAFTWASVAETEPELWDRMLALNATSAFLCSRAALPRMRSRRWGRILTVSALPAVHGGAAQMSAYSAAKAALLNFTQSLAKELAGTGITANAVVPAIVDTPTNRKALPDADTSVWLDPAAVAKVMAFLATEAAGIVTGSAIELAVV